ncbi:MAG: hypothetical protein ACHREM_11050 [Polyangiales bacterium]
MSNLDDRTTRAILDERALASLHSPNLGEISAFASRPAYLTGQRLSKAERLSGTARLYTVEYRMKYLVGPGPTAEGTLVLFDVSSLDYPGADPSVSIRRKPLPWSPHVQPFTGVACIGEGWRLANGYMLLAELVVHVMRLLNCDEPDRGAAYGGYNPEAADYWRETLGRGVLDRTVEYPLISTEVSHGVVPPLPTFRRVGPRFAAAPPAPRFRRTA